MQYDRRPREGISIAQAKECLSELVDRAEAGETIDIIRHGKLAARLSPPVREKRKLEAGKLAALTDALPFQKEEAAQTIRAMRDSDRY